MRWSIVAPAATGIAAAASSPTSLTTGWISKRSSSRPTAAQTQAPSRIACARPPSDGQQQHRDGDGDEHRDPAAERDRPGVQAPVRAAVVDQPEPRRDPRRDRRQPERQHARERERDERVEAGLRHGRAFTVTARTPAPPGPIARTRNTSLPCRGAVNRSCTPLPAEPPCVRLRDDAPVR